MSRQERLVPGWLGQSSLPPQRRQEIEGVSAKTAIALKAVTEQAKEHARDQKDGLVAPGPRRGKGLDLAAKLGPSNAGVSQRDERDRLHVKQTTGDRHSEVQEALARKARQYELLQSGQLRDDEGNFEVDFSRKEASTSGRWAEDQAHEAVDTTGLAVGGSGGLLSADMQRERERRAWEQQEDQRRAAEERRREHKEDIRDIHEDALDRRERAEAAKREKEERQAKLKEKLLQDKVREILQKKQKKDGSAPLQEKKKRKLGAGE